MRERVCTHREAVFCHGRFKLFPLSPPHFLDHSLQTRGLLITEPPYNHQHHEMSHLQAEFHCSQPNSAFIAEEIPAPFSGPVCLLDSPSAHARCPPFPLGISTH